MEPLQLVRKFVGGSLELIRRERGSRVEDGGGEEVGGLGSDTEEGCWD